MKATNWLKKTAATLVACGLSVPAWTQAANLDANVVTNPGFENVDIFTVGSGYDAVKILNWNDGTQFGYAYSVAQEFDAGGPLAGGGNYYFTSNGEGNGTPPAEIMTAGQVSQIVDVSAGASGALIASSEGSIRLSAQMTSYSADFDQGHVQVDFLSASNAVLGSTEIRDLDSGHLNVWSLNLHKSGLPYNTAKLKVSVFADANTFGPDGYIDNIDVQVTSALDEVVYLEVNTASGQATIKNQSGAPVRLDYYDVTSAGGALNPSWTGIQGQSLPGFPAGDGTGNGWEKNGAPSANGLSESFLDNLSLLNSGGSIPLGSAFNVGGAHDLVFRYTIEPRLDQTLEADFDLDGDVDGADVLAFQRGLDELGEGDGDVDLDVDVDARDLQYLKDQFAGGHGENEMVWGAVRYVTPVATVVPEPGAVLLIGLGTTLLAAARPRR